MVEAEQVAEAELRRQIAELEQREIELRVELALIRPTINTLLRQLDGEGAAPAANWDAVAEEMIAARQV